MAYVAVFDWPAFGVFFLAFLSAFFLAFLSFFACLVLFSDAAAAGAFGLAIGAALGAGAAAGATGAAGAAAWAKTVTEGMASAAAIQLESTTWDKR